MKRSLQKTFCFTLCAAGAAIFAAACAAPELTIEQKNVIAQIRNADQTNVALPANVNFCEVIGTDHVLIRTYERGVEDFTYACGTGAGSTVAALTLQGLVSGQNVRVSMPGGDLFVTAECQHGAVQNLWLTGPTNIVCTGEVTDETLFETIHSVKETDYE